MDDAQPPASGATVADAATSTISTPQPCVADNNAQTPQEQTQPKRDKAGDVENGVDAKDAGVAGPATSACAVPSVTQPRPPSGEGDGAVPTLSPLRTPQTTTHTHVLPAVPMPSVLPPIPPLPVNIANYTSVVGNGGTMAHAHFSTLETSAVHQPQMMPMTPNTPLQPPPSVASMKTPLGNLSPAANGNTKLPEQKTHKRGRPKKTSNSHRKAFEAGHPRFERALQQLIEMRQKHAQGLLPSIRGFMQTIHMGFANTNAVVKYYANNYLNTTLDEFKRDYMVIRRIRASQKGKGGRPKKERSSSSNKGDDDEDDEESSGESESDDLECSQNTNTNTNTHDKLKSELHPPAFHANIMSAMPLMAGNGVPRTKADANLTPQQFNQQHLQQQLFLNQIQRQNFRIAETLQLSTSTAVAGDGSGGMHMGISPFFAATQNYTVHDAHFATKQEMPTLIADTAHTTEQQNGHGHGGGEMQAPDCKRIKLENGYSAVNHHHNHRNHNHSDHINIINHDDSGGVSSNTATNTSTETTNSNTRPSTTSTTTTTHHRVHQHQHHQQHVENHHARHQNGGVVMFDATQFVKMLEGDLSVLMKLQSNNNHVTATTTTMTMTKTRSLVSPEDIQKPLQVVRKRLLAMLDRKLYHRLSHAQKVIVAKANLIAGICTAAIHTGYCKDALALYRQALALFRELNEVAVQRGLSEARTHLHGDELLSAQTAMDIDPFVCGLVAQEAWNTQDAGQYSMFVVVIYYQMSLLFDKSIVEKLQKSRFYLLQALNLLVRENALNANKYCIETLQRLALFALESGDCTEYIKLMCCTLHILRRHNETASRILDVEIQCIKHLLHYTQRLTADTKTSTSSEVASKAAVVRHEYQKLVNGMVTSAKQHHQTLSPDTRHTLTRLLELSRYLLHAAQLNESYKIYHCMRQICDHTQVNLDLEFMKLWIDFVKEFIQGIVAQDPKLYNVQRMWQEQLLELCEFDVRVLEKIGNSTNIPVLSDLYNEYILCSRALLAINRTHDEQICVRVQHYLRQAKASTEVEQQKQIETLMQELEQQNARTDARTESFCI